MYILAIREMDRFVFHTEYRPPCASSWTSNVNGANKFNSIPDALEFRIQYGYSSNLEVITLEEALITQIISG